MHVSNVSKAVFRSFNSNLIGKVSKDHQAGGGPWLPPLPTLTILSGLAVQNVLNTQSTTLTCILKGAPTAQGKRTIRASNDSLS